MRRLAPSLFGLALSAVLLGVLAAGIDLGQMRTVLARSDPALLPLALLGLALDLAARTVRWRVLLARPPRPGYGATFRYLAIGYLVNDVLPGRLGELVRAHLLGRREGVGTSRALGSIALERGLDVVVAAALGLLAVLALGIGGPLRGGFALLAGGSLAALLVLALAPHRWLRGVIDGLAGRVTPRPLAAVLPRVVAFLHALLDAAAPRAVWPGLALSILAWLATAGVFLVAAYALALHLALPAVLLLAMAANLGTAIPSAPAGIGPFEFAVVWVGAAVGLDPSSALLLGVLSHLLTVVPVCLVGAVGLVGTGWDGRGIAKSRPIPVPTLPWLRPP
ncbi:MAG: lysylphosphatidylglycerol synthase transmembrane domain-containing protein [Candidatus Limnocylindrales bacterium]